MFIGVVIFVMSVIVQSSFHIVCPLILTWLYEFYILAQLMFFPLSTSEIKGFIEQPWEYMVTDIVFYLGSENTENFSPQILIPEDSISFSSSPARSKFRYLYMKRNFCGKYHLRKTILFLPLTQNSWVENRRVSKVTSGMTWAKRQWGCSEPTCTRVLGNSTWKPAEDAQPGFLGRGEVRFSTRVLVRRGAPSTEKSVSLFIEWGWEMFDQCLMWVGDK